MTGITSSSILVSSSSERYASVSILRSKEPVGQLLCMVTVTVTMPTAVLVVAVVNDVAADGTSAW